MMIIRNHQETIDYLNSVLTDGTKITKITRGHVYFEKIEKPQNNLNIPPYIKHLSEAEIALVKTIDLNEIPENCTESINSAISQGHKIAAIKALRYLTSLGLKDAKDVIEFNF